MYQTNHLPAPSYHVNHSPTSNGPGTTSYWGQSYPDISPTGPGPAEWPSTPKRSRKRVREAENTADSSNEDEFRLPLSPSKGRPKKRRKTTRRVEIKLTENERMVICLDAIIDKAGWSLADFLRRLFAAKDLNQQAVHNSQRHAQSLGCFLRGEYDYTPAMLVNAMLRHPYGHIKPSGDDEDENQLMYSTFVQWTEIKPVRPALTSFAAQTVMKELTREAEEAVKPESGLHAMRYHRKGRASDDDTRKDVTWADIGSVTFKNVAAIVQKHQPLTWTYALALAQREPKNRPASESAAVNGNSETPVDGSAPGSILDGDRKYRPPHIAALHAITSLDFSRTNRANLLPTAAGLLHFAMSAPVDIIHYHSRQGVMPSYNTLYSYLDRFATEEGKIVHAHGSNRMTASAMWLDNVQNYDLQRDVRLGLQSRLNSGLAATYVEGVDSEISAFDLAKKRELLAENKRNDVTVEQLRGYIDWTHRDLMGTLHFLRILVEHVPQLNHLKSRVSERFRTDGAKQQVPVHKSRVHPLRSSGKKETVTTELKDAMLDFLGQAGQGGTKASESSLPPQLIIVGGDGLTYEKLLQLKNYLGFQQGDPVGSLEIVEPVLALWHTGWTEACRIFTRHWGPALSRDESTLGHSAIKMGRTTPSNLSKVDYKEGVETLFTVLDARVLDCFRVRWDVADLFAYFAQLARDNALPTFEQLELIARELYRAYGTSRGYERAMHPQSDHDRTTELASNTGQQVTAWEQTIPIGRPWITVRSSGLTANTPSSRTRQAAQATAPPVVSKSSRAKKTAHHHVTLTDIPSGEPAFNGDRVLAQSIALIRDTVILREFVYATCEGDVGRVYEALKVMVFTFAGSSHSKYTAYLLEMICNLELESTPSLRHAVLSNLLVNLTGNAGSFLPGDLMQEYFNRLLEAVAEKKGVEYGEHFIRDIISPNLHHFASLLNDLKDGVGLKHRSGRHTAPNLRHELSVLASIYQETELHSRRRGREYAGPAREVDDFKRGYEKLRGGKLKKWVKESLFARSRRVPINTPDTTATDSMPDAATDENNDEEEVDEASDVEWENGDGSAHAALQRARQPLSSAWITDGQLVVETLDLGPTTIDHLLAKYDASSEGEEEEGSTSELVDN
ncbi:hypothetical protein EVJ58_g2953 [Rhodofomes roseus]|uniref:DUF6589 domain-containing protein n=1 Tax=Rhodofomes roseus TaxID=34475 RepID=A0A4Y9YMU5_9APHY|nr:hypothetical protein EVJ58_g2953 [Rhodofomes roseus]